MNKKKLFTVVGATALIGAIGIGSTLAYFTDTEDTTNVITMGNVNIDLTEPNYEGKDNDNTVTNIVPGQTITKDPTVTVAEGSEDAYVRIKVDFEGTDEAFTNAMIFELIDSIVIDDTWVCQVPDPNAPEFCYYYTESLAAGKSVTLFDEVVIPERWNNDIANKTIKMNITAEAIQADNFEPTVVDGVYGWYYSDGEAISAENYDSEVLPQQ